MDEPQKKVILEMVGTQGLLELDAISTLLPANHTYADSYLLACHLLNMGIDNCKKVVQQLVSDFLKGDKEK